jgi:hypothetical protein
MTSRRSLLAGLLSLPALAGRKEGKTATTPGKPAIDGTAPQLTAEQSPLGAVNVAAATGPVTFSTTGFGSDVNDALNGQIGIADVPSAAQAPMLAFTWGDSTQGTEGGFYIHPVTGSIILAPGTVITPTSPGSDTGWDIPETWQTAAYSGSWEAAASGTDLKYRLLPDNSVRLTGRLKLSSGSVSGSSTVASIPTGYVPARDEPVVVYAHAAGSPYAEVSGLLLAKASGVFEYYGSFTTSDTLEIAGTYPLDA